MLRLDEGKGKKHSAGWTDQLEELGWAARPRALQDARATAPLRFNRGRAVPVR